MIILEMLNILNNYPDIITTSINPFKIDGILMSIAADSVSTSSSNHAALSLFAFNAATDIRQNPPTTNDSHQIISYIWISILWQYRSLFKYPLYFKLRFSNTN